MLLALDGTEKPAYHPDTQQLRTKYSKVFSDLPPSRSPNRGIEHIIELEKGTVPVMITPYQHPKRLKHVIEKTIQELFTMGHIRLSKFPFASAVALVKKIDGTLRMHMDHWMLNRKTIKNQ